MIINIFFYIFTFLFLLKILHNLSIPFLIGLIHLDNKKEGGERKHFSITPPILEILFLLIIFVLPFFAEEGTWLSSSKDIGLWGLLLILISYVWIALFLMIIGFILSKFKISPKDDPSLSP